MAEAADEGRPRASALTVGLETSAATAGALYLSLRLGSPLVWMLVPLGILLAGRMSFSDHGLDLRFRPPSWTTHAILGASLLILYAAIHAWVAGAVLGQRFFAPRLSAELPLEVVQEFLAIGVPEEVFFRGYLQSRWNAGLGRPWRLFGARLGWGYLIQAAVFAVCHLATGDWTRLRVFFFALLAGWLRERSGSILGPAVYHGVANVWYRMLIASFR
jgi:membrane protease YdiL (CAAX protease family)